MINRQYHKSFICLGFLISLSSVGKLIAQNTSFEFWPETDIWYRLSPSWRLSAFVPVTKYHESQERDLNIYLQADYAWGQTKNSIYMRLVDQNRYQLLKTWMVRPGYMAGWSLDDPENSYAEDMIFAEIHRRIPIKGNVLISQRIRSDFRWVGQEPEFSYRIRYRLMVEKEVSPRKTSVVPYFNIEPFYDSRYNYFNRVRIIGGTTISWKSWFALEGNLTYQYDGHYSTKNLYALNVIIHIFFETKRHKV